ncbi:threonine/serine ThrE exporter family protein [Mumia sp. DW29H23]|uniref:threonine/serine ThrE exporter family protein n=1 Tax=Mumia sp. DW29H23 TaxID=3421241 RepID=UPI003D6845DE
MSTPDEPPDAPPGERAVSRRRRTSDWWRSGVAAVARRILKQPDEVEPPDAAPSGAEILAMLRAFAAAQLEVGQPANLVEESIRTIAKAYGVETVRAVVLPTVVIIEIESTDGDETEHRTEIEPIRSTDSRLDQAGAIEQLVTEAMAGHLVPAEAVERIDAVRASDPRFGTFTATVGYVVLCVGFGLSLNPHAAALGAYAALGLVVGVLRLIARAVPTLQAALPVFAAFTVTVITCAFVAGTVGDEPLRIIAPSLVTFLPGLTLTVAAVELTSNQVVAGASRIVYGTAQLLLLTFGVVVGVQVAGGLPDTTTGEPLGAWAPFAGVVCVSVGYLLFQSAPPRSLVWLVLALLVAYVAQRIGGELFGATLSGFFGALAVVPFTRFAAAFRTAPTSMVMLLAAFWFLVPGAIGFISLGEAASGSAAGVQALLTTFLSLFSIALGFLVGTALTREVRDLQARTAARPRQ